MREGGRGLNVQVWASGKAMRMTPSLGGWVSTLKPSPHPDDASCGCVPQTESIVFDFCVAKMAQSKAFTLDSARLVLSHPLCKSGKALLRFFKVVDSVSFLDSESIGLDSRILLDCKSVK